MGRVQIPLSILSEETTARWYPLGRGSAKDNVHGEIFLELTLTASQVQYILLLLLFSVDAYNYVVCQIYFGLFLRLFSKHVQCT